MQIGVHLLSFNELMVVLDNVTIDSEKRKIIKSTAKHHYDFVDFVAEKLSTTNLAAEVIIQLNQTKLITKKIEEKYEANPEFFDSDEAHYIFYASVVADYAKSWGFPESEELGKLAIIISDVLKEITE